MVPLPQEPWTMKVALNRKRSRLAFDSDDEGQGRAESVFAPAMELKKTKSRSDIDEMEVIAPEEAWSVDMDSILASPTFPTWAGAGDTQPHNNVSRYARDSSIMVLCVQGNLHLHYELLCGMLPDLYTISPSLQALVLCRDPSTHVPSMNATISLPLIQAVGTNYNHFVRLGLLHPLGGGQFPLDALVVVDAKGRRRLVLPFGWGGGRHAATPAGRGVQKTLMELLRTCIQTLTLEG